MPEDTQTALLTELAGVRDDIAEIETRLQPRLVELRQRRDALICDARRAGAIGDVLAEASGINRQSVHAVLRAHHVPTPPRTRSAPGVRTRTDLRRALGAAGINPDDDPDGLGTAVRAALDTDTEE